MKTPLIALVMLLATVNIADVADAQLKGPPYIGCWSDYSGSTLSVTPKAMKFGVNKPTKYQDITKRPDGKRFLLRTINPGRFNFLSNYILLTIERDEMHMEMFSSYEDFTEHKIEGEDRWVRDKCQKGGFGKSRRLTRG